MLTRIKVSDAVRTYGDNWVRHVWPEYLLSNDTRDMLIMRRCANLMRRHGRLGSMVDRAEQWWGTQR